MPTKTHIEDAQRLMDIALSSSRAHKYDETRILIRSALHFLFEDKFDPENEERFANLCLWESLSPTPKRLQEWSNDFNSAIDELNENQDSATYIILMRSFFDHELIVDSERQACFDEVSQFIAWLSKNENDERSNNESAKQILSTSDAAKMFGVTSQTVLTWCKTGRMPGAYQTPGGTWRIPRQSLQKIKQLLKASAELDSYIPDQEAVNEAVSKRRKAWRR